MPSLAPPGAPLAIPSFVHLILWPLLLVWTLFLIHRRRVRGWPCSPRFGACLVPGCMLVDAAALVASMRWPYPGADSFVFAVLWVAVLFSITTYFALRTPGHDGGGGDEHAADPEPPWWPEFERELRDYMRRAPRPPARPPQTPAGVPQASGAGGGSGP